tara:strand:- start:15244 stop:16263 length:1020 start_codon:yes stop_codon:yes gene_type:complete
MRSLNKFLENFGRAFVPRRFAPFIHEYLLKAGYSTVPYKLFGSMYYISIILTTIIYLILFYPLLIGFSFWKMFFLTFVSWGGLNLFLVILMVLMVYFYFDLKIFKRTVRIEEMFPDFLEQVSSNLKGGMTFENAMWNSINPRFKTISSEITEVMKKVLTGTSTSDALKNLGRKYDSGMLKRTIDLIVGELDSGGNISNLLDRMAKDLERIKEMKNEMTASVIGYMIMVSVIVIFVAPLLFALSFHLLIIIIGFLEVLEPRARAPLLTPIKISASELSPGDFKLFSVITILTISLIASFIVSIIEKGDIKGGLKYIPIYTIGSVAAYFVILGFISSIFSF